jgi:hypothetical protein
MLSVASVRSASGAANYFAKDDFKDNYYTADGSSEVSAWGGEGPKRSRLKAKSAAKASSRF